MPWLSNAATICATRSARSAAARRANGAVDTMASHSRRVISMSIRHQQSRGTLDERVARQIELLERRRIRHRRVERADDADGRVERFEGFFLNDRGKAFANATGSHVLVDDQHLVTAARHRKHSFAI